MGCFRCDYLACIRRETTGLILVGEIGRGLGF